MSRRTSQPGDRRQGLTRDLYGMIDEHLAWQMDQSERERPTSSGTMFVDWDGSASPKITYRNSKKLDAEQPEPEREPHAAESHAPRPPAKSKPKPKRATQTLSRHDSLLSNQRTFRKQTAPAQTIHASSSSSDSLQITYYSPPHFSKSTNTLKAAGYVAGYAPCLDATYDYNGRIVHVHRDAARREERFSEYYAVDAEAYSTAAKLEVVDVDADGNGNGVGAGPPIEERKKRDRVVGFVEKLLHRLDRLGFMAKFRAERRHAAAAGGRSWVEHGYVT
ncbi:uncharacterized protein K460DRAFT_353853 [Cucurbitaria berberidis CBS 394.84]|uniref:Uncharacterized protein n=1 Tax=Cucurbitaria berberidis CBS 394.84 TaxID=1168544 RepID=A0A9P4GNQ1_9PLEO|nr:uncharacterized protein K460DRAFT_353853 [Cucurbitaria berberidis CBS 394.84]KAF1848925.1 hypothetical protein K460DRAFT_353853 [Cucurbitaria berberidis CBS 394.84]